MVPLNVNYRNCQLQIPTGKDVHCISSKTLATPTTQSMRNHHHLELLLFSNRLSLKTPPPPTSYFFSIKQHSSPLFVGLAYGFWVSLCGCVLSHSVISARLLCPWDSFSCLILQFLCYSWTDPLLLVKQHFKVNLFIPVSHNPHSFTMLPGVTSQGNHPLAPNPCLRLCC